ncbi:MAG: prepilin-type N-terminal cleavage/methylation domain-containing protein [Gammaproteobacteria bacterium]|nr:prepilin-type N-terminal cleavage/methylation domain-containing protein [Gammaproteobacteria bacterium]
MRNKSHIRGYTLIEVLVAFMILALALTVLLRIFSSGLRNVSASSDYTRAVLVAEAQLAAAGVSDVLLPGETQGDEGRHFHWTRVIRDYVPSEGYDREALLVPAYHITVIVEWQHAGGTRQIDLSSIRLGKTRSAP